LDRIDIVSERGRGRSREQATTTTTAAGEPLAGLTFIVNDMECCQANIGNFILVDRNFLTHCGVAHRRIWSRPDCCRHCARHCQRQSRRSQNRYGFTAMRGLLHTRHLNSPGQERASIQQVMLLRGDATRAVSKISRTSHKNERQYFGAKTIHPILWDELRATLRSRQPRREKNASISFPVSAGADFLLLGSARGGAVVGGRVFPNRAPMSLLRRDAGS
jgi:hypothetical protein